MAIRNVTTQIAFIEFGNNQPDPCDTIVTDFNHQEFNDGFAFVIGGNTKQRAIITAISTEMGCHDKSVGFFVRYH